MTIKSILAVVAIIAVVSIITTSVKSISALDHSSSNTTTSAIKVQAGGGNATAPLTVFVPQNVEIKAGESVTWDNPTTVGEPHTVTFVLDNNTMTNIVSPFAVPNSTEFAAIPPNSNNEPLKVPGKNNVVIGVNARSFVPTVIDSQGSVKQFAPPNAAYTMNGSEKYVNSGWLLPKGQEQSYPGSGNTFTVTFQKAGTYSYICGLHPWMVGTVVVK
ncbi:MAG: plastocyanin/azurin family copper-binding protein [Nitrososphaeraceae archaeon]